ncbi:hypothetical protein [Hymenobacter cheonanensis]|uniref:hypothetical protein n=1 Tax=Hymenobacter sp. CA2-7 TaxID=3063993 RepID=UPI002713AEBE|nr:hypothetical protein [Hymenobacter sp. CA2-7]MDO7885996.1 hypothetical protein [Hymenobacter sp. CA2-7]
MPRPYLHHAAATVRYLRREYGRQTMPQIAAELGIALPKLQELARRQGIKKQWVRT